MSTKTLRKRIALVAVSALGAGLLSVAPANAAAPDHNAISQSTASVSASADVLNIATLNGVSASAAASGATTGTSNGLLAVSTTPGVTGTATLLSTGALSVYTAAPASSALPVIIVSGATITSATVGSGNTIVNSAQTAVSGSANATLAAVVKPNAGVTSFVVSLYTGASATATNPGTLRTQYIVTVATASAAGVYSAGDSAVSLSSAYQSATLTTGDVSGASTTIALAGTGFVNFSLKDAYGSALASGAIVAQSAKGSYVKLVTATSTANTASTDVAAAAPTNYAVRVDNATPGTPVSDTITVTYNGVVVATRTILFVGKAASITVHDIAVNKLSATTGDSNDTFQADLKDSAGNLLLATGRTAFWSAASGTNNTVTSVAVDAAAAIDGSGVYSSAKGTHACASTAGTASIVLQYVNTDGTVVKSAPFTLSCAGAAYTYTAAFDKASYVTGEIAKLTVSFKDSKGNAANDFDTIPAGTGNRYVEASFPQLTIVGTAPSATQTPAGGVIELKYSVGTSTGITAGTWTGTVNVASLNSTTTPQTIQTVTYKVGTGESGVTNADVLKAIVSLIASINKQIAALQKALLKK